MRNWKEENGGQVIGIKSRLGFSLLFGIIRTERRKVKNERQNERECGILKCIMAKKQDKPRLDDSIEPSAVEISVAASGFLKPYLACFRYSPENIDKEPLGALVGVLSIRDRSEDSAYIVNFLASLAKKEYYANARRNAVESFESTLHKVNIGLSELVKEGNANWVGTLDAALCVFERNSLHFAVAGDAKVILIRDGRLIDVSDGLTEGQDPHPLKTFTEVSSGKVRADDRLLITTPEIFSIITSGELERASNRLDDQAFDQFIRTAAVNRLDFSGTIIIHIRKIISEEKAPKKKSSLASPEYVPNAWSLSAFSNSKKPTSDKNLATSREEALSRERIDDKTGHIYVTGETPEVPPNEQWEAFRVRFDDFRIWAGKSGKRMALSLSAATVAGARFAGHAFSQGRERIAQAFSTWQKARAERLELQKAKQDAEHSKKTSLSEQEQPNTLPKEVGNEIPSIPHQPRQKHVDTVLKNASTESLSTAEVSPESPSTTQQTPEDPNTLHAQLSNFYQKQADRSEKNIPSPTDTPSSFTSKSSDWIDSAHTVLSRCFAALGKFCRSWLALWKSASRRTKYSIIAAAILLLTGIALIFWRSSSNSTLTSETPEDTSSTSPTDTGSGSVKNSAKTNAAVQAIDHFETNFQGSDAIRATLLLKEVPYAVSTHEIISLGGASPETFPFPDGKTAKYAAAMPDIGTIFVLTNDGSLLGYTPSNNKFSENTIDLPSGDALAGIDTFLTYLYALDTAEGTIYRYARVEGGFGAKTDWMKEKDAIPFGASFAVNESVALADGSNIFLLERGAKLPISFEHPFDTLLFTAVFISENNTIFALDNKSGRLVEYDGNGAIVHQYSGDLFRDATDFAVDTNTKTLFVANGSSILSAGIE